MAEYKEHNISSHVTIRDEEGNNKQYRVEAFFDMDEKSYALLTSKEESLLMRVEGDELVGIADPEERDNILDAYEIALHSLPDAEQSELKTK